MTHERTVWISLPVQVEFTYQPKEAPDTGPEAQYPGCDETIEIEGVFIGRAEITTEISGTIAAEIETELWDVINSERNAA